MFSILLIVSSVFIESNCLIIYKPRLKENQEICLKNHFQSISTSNLRICYRNNRDDQSLTISFTIDQRLYEIFHFYRFILRSIDDRSLATINIYKLTNFTELNDYNNSLTIFNLNSGQYEICIDFQMNSTAYIYSPRYSCIPIQLGQFLHGTFKQSSMELLIALTIGIIIFLIFCYLVHSKNVQQSSSSSLRRQRDRLIRKIFRRHFDETTNSQMQQWARNRAFRHRIASIQDRRFTSNEQTQTSNDEIYTISRKFKTNTSFNL